MMVKIKVFDAVGILSFSSNTIKAIASKKDHTDQIFNSDVIKPFLDLKW